MLSRYMFRQFISMRVHPKAWPFVCGSLGLTVILMWLIPGRLFALLGLSLTAFMLFFFRNPPRAVPQLEGGVLSPADGLIVEITTNQNPPDDLAMSHDGSWIKVGIFLSPFDAHLNRSPVNGTIVEKAYVKGTFQHVATAETRITNERLSLVLKTPHNETVVCTQIAGFLARRIICDVGVKDTLKAGDLYGLICFGSRVDLYLPSQTTLLVSRFQRVVAGETIVGFLPSSPFHPQKSSV